MMMRKNRKVRMNVSGVQTPEDGWMRVSEAVNVPDGEAGCEWMRGRTPFQATEVRRISQQRSWTVPLNGAALFLCLLFVAFGVAALTRTAAKAKITKDISAMEQSIANTVRDNTELALEVAAARDYEHIRALAKNNLNMIEPQNVVPVMIEAPETRPGRTAQTTQGYSASYDARDGIISGGR